ncbi:MAG: hypothetical protein QM478_11190 [Flavobacteriaceae bacterium]
MKKNILIVLFLSVYTFSNAQNSNLEINRIYKPIERVQKKDSSYLKNAIFLKNDTLIVTSSKIKNSFLLDLGVIDSCFIEQYKNIVFGDKEYRNKYKKKEIKLWTSTIKVFFAKNVKPYLKNEMLSLFEKIDYKIDGISIEVVNQKNKSNYFIYTIDNKKHTTELYPNINSKNDISYSLQSNNKNHFYFGALRINTNKVFNKKEQVYKMKEMFIRTLGGFTLSSSLNCNSFLSDCYSISKELSENDIELINFHYKNIFDQEINYRTYEKILKKYNSSKEKASHKYAKIKI